MTERESLFTLPSPNPPDQPPPVGDVVAVWHATRGLVRARFDGPGRWTAVIDEVRSPYPPWLRIADVIGWWPDPKPVPSRPLQCAACGHVEYMPAIPGPTGRPVLDITKLSSGWTFDADRVEWRCPSCNGIAPRPVPQPVQLAERAGGLSAGEAEPPLSLSSVID